VKEDVRNLRFEIRERSYLNARVCNGIVRNLHELECYDQRWSETIKSIEANGELHKYLSGDPRFTGRQRILRYKGKNGISVVILTSIDSRTRTVKRTGSAWVMIIDPRSSRPYFWFELRRTLNFATRIIDAARLMIAIVNHWPQCPGCKLDLQLVTVKGFMLMRAFNCLNKDRHLVERPYFLITTMELPEQYRHMLKDRYDEYYMYKEAEFEEGHEREYACVIRSQRNRQKKLAQEMRLAVREEQYSDTKNEPKNGETYYYNDGPHAD
jgi:hypothetical protein